MPTWYRSLVLSCMVVGITLLKTPAKFVIFQNEGTLFDAYYRSRMSY